MKNRHAKTIGFALLPLTAGAGGRLDLALFGEGQSRIVVSCAAGRRDELLAQADAAGVPARQIGTVGGRELRWGAALNCSLDELGEAWGHGFYYLFA